MSSGTCFAWPKAALLVAFAALFPLLMPLPAPAQSAPGVKVSVLHAANYPSTLTVGPDGSLWGTTDDAHSTLFKVTLGGLFHPLIEFTGTNALAADANSSNNLPPGFDQSKGPLLLLSNGSFFGSRLYGGASGTGGLFQFTPKRRYQVKHQFTYRDSQQINVDGAYPVLPMAQGPDGAVYGVTELGGNLGGGVLFRYTAAKGVEVLHEFEYSVYGSNLYNGVTVGPDGAIYGTMVYGGPAGGGTIFRVTTAGVFSILYAFDGRPGMASGYSPSGVPVVGPDGALYGTTYGGGGVVKRGSQRYNGAGTVYRITTDGDLTILYTFAPVDAASEPFAALALGPDGKLYGKSRAGALFRITTKGTLTLLLSNANHSLDIGSNTRAGLVFGRDNRLYVSGTAAIYKITVPF